MREIKFRAWDTDFNDWLDITGMGIWKGKVNGIFHDGDYIGLEETTIIMQYTGMKDSEGTEIYEGDILEWIVKGYLDDGEVEVKHTYCMNVKMYDGMTWVCLHGKDTELFKWQVKEWELKVIGNIYENPELIK